MVTHYGNSACEGSSPYQLKMAAPAEVSKKRSNFRIRQFYKKRHFNLAANLTLNTMVSFIILLIARTARIACPDRQTDRMTDRIKKYLIKWVELARNAITGWGEHDIRISVPFMRDTTHARARKYGDCHLVARKCDNEVGVAISIRDPYTSPFTSRCK